MYVLTPHNGSFAIEPLLFNRAWPSDNIQTYFNKSCMWREREKDVMFQTRLTPILLKKD